MEEKVIHWEKVFFNAYLKSDGTLIKTNGFSLKGEVLLFYNLSYTKRIEKVATVSINSGELYFVPFNSLLFLYELN